MELFRETAKGISWVGGFRFTSRLIAYGKLAIIARLLTPELFGVYGIATLVLAFLEIFTETGINTVLIQEKKKIDKYINTAWIISVIRGIVIAIVIFTSAPFVSRFFASPQVYVLLTTISLVPLIRGFINPSVVKFHKDLDFRKEFWFRISIFSLDAIVAVIFVYITKNPIGMVWGFVAGAILEVLLSFVIVKPIPSVKFSSKRAKEIVARGKWITGTGIFQYLFRQGDDIVVGKLLGESSLGIYQAAYKLSTLPVSEVADVVSKVSFPTYVKIVDDVVRLKRVFLKTTLVIIVLSLGLGGIIYIFSDLVVLVVLGNNWTEVVPILRVLIIFGVLKAISSSFHSIFLATHKQHWVASLTLVSTISLGVVIFPLLSNYGLIGVAYSTVIGSFASLPISLIYLRKLFKSI